VKILLDTCDFLWFISGDSSLPSKTIAAVQDPENDVFLSVASIWEIMIKHGRGKLILSDSPSKFIPEQREIHRIQSLPILESAVKRLTDLPEFHRDPFDRIIICQALDEGMILASSDPMIAQYPVRIL
jgi:PIN domain nuclease of toxin-antitoxin system